MYSIEIQYFYSLYSIKGYYKIMAIIPYVIEYILVAYVFYFIFIYLYIFLAALVLH